MQKKQKQPTKNMHFLVVDLPDSTRSADQQAPAEY